MEVKEELLIDRWFGSCLLGFGFSSVRLDGRKVRISRRSSEIKQTGCRERRNNPSPKARTETIIFVVGQCQYQQPDL